MWYSRSLGYGYQKEIIEECLVQSSLGSKKIVVTNFIEQHFGEYYLGFVDGGTTFLSYDEAKTYSFGTGSKVYLLNCWLTNFRLGKEFGDLPGYAQNAPTLFRLVKENKGASLYEVWDVSCFR